MSDHDREYLQRRRRECLAQAESAKDPAVANIHRQFAKQYERALSSERHKGMRVITS